MGNTQLLRHKRLKILYVTGRSDLYGASRSLLRLTEALVKEGQQTWVVLPEGGPLKEALQALGVEVIVQGDLAVLSRVGDSRLMSAMLLAIRCLSSSWRMVRTIRRLRPDIVHSNTATVLSGAIAARLTGVTHVWHIREVFSEFPILWRWYRELMNVLSARIICVSQAVAAQFRGSAAEKKARVIYDGLPEHDCAPPGPEAVREFRSRFNISPDARVAAVVGRIKCGAKGQETFLQAAASIAERVPGAVFLIIGEAFPGNERHACQLKDMAGELRISSRTIFTGEIEDMRVAYAAMDLLVLPSGHPEGFGLVLIEAMSFGKPVIGTAHGGAMEIIEDGKSGYLVPPHCPEKMAEAMERVLTDADLSLRLGSNGRRRVLELFRFETFCQSLRSTYASLVQRPALVAAGAHTGSPGQVNGTQPEATSKGIRVLYVHSGSDLYGASRSLLRLAKVSVGEGRQLWVVLPESGPLQAALETLGVGVMVQRDLAVVSRADCGHPLFPALLALRCLSSSWRLARTIRRLRPDIVHSNTATVMSGAIAAWIARVPHVWHIREIFGEFPILWPCYRWFMNACSAKIICISAAVAAQFNDSPAKRKVSVIHNGVGAEDFEPPCPRAVREFRSRFNIPPAARVAAVVGRIKFGRKGQETFVRAAASIAGRVPNAVFLIIGTAFPGKERQVVRLKALIDELGVSDRIVLTGEIEDMRVAYSAIDLLVLPSGLPEPFGLVLIEAMSFGKPVIGTAHGGAPEIIEDGKCGYLVPPNCPERMAEAMERVLSDRELGARLGNNGKRRVLDHFRFEASYASLQATYSGLMQQPVLPTPGVTTLSCLDGKKDEVGATR